MCPLFKKQSYLGIDLGSTSIKIVELRKEKQGPTLVTYGYAEKAEGDIIRGTPEEIQQRTIETLKKLCQQAGVTTNKAITALPNFSVFSSIITLPVMKKDDLKNAIFWKVKRIIPISLEETILDWKILGKVAKIEGKKPEGLNASLKKKKSGENYRILITAASKNLVKKYLEIFKLSNFQLLSLETEGFALSRALIGKDPSTVVIIDISAVSTDIIIIEKMIPVLTRSIDVGGVVLTKAIASSLNIDFRRAEQFKKDLGIGGDNRIPDIIEATLKPVVDEIRYSLKIYQSQSSQKIEKIVLSGGSAYLLNLSEYFSQLLNVKVIVSNPWKRIVYPIELEPALLEIAPRFAVAIGLALREVE